MLVFIVVGEGQAEKKKTKQNTSRSLLEGKILSRLDSHHQSSQRTGQLGFWSWKERVVFCFLFFSLMHQDRMRTTFSFGGLFE